MPGELSIEWAKGWPPEIGALVVCDVRLHSACWTGEVRGVVDDEVIIIRYTSPGWKAAYRILDRIEVEVWARQAGDLRIATREEHDQLRDRIIKWRAENC